MRLVNCFVSGWTLLLDKNYCVMKNLVCTVLLTTLLGGIPIMAQQQNELSGNVVYEDVMKLEINLEGEAAQYSDMLPKERRSSKILIFNPSASLYENHKEDASDPVAISGAGMHMEFKMAEPDNKIFYDLDGNEQIEQREFMTRQFLIKGEIDPAAWKLTGNEKTIMDYPCQEAIKEENGKQIKAWFTPAIPVSSGPADYVGLPGLVLNVDIDNGKRIIAAQEIKLGPVDKKLLKKPKKGKKVSREEFDAIVAEKMKEMGAEGEGGQGTMMIHITK